MRKRTRPTITARPVVAAAIPPGVRPVVPGLRKALLGVGPAPLAAAAILLAAVGCGAGADREAGASVRTDSAGITIVTRPGPDLPVTLSLQVAFRLGGSDERPEEAFFQVGPNSVGVDAAGRIHVLDASANRLQVFDAAGVHLRTLGRPGQGPGEIGIPGGLTVSPDGTVAVMDFSRRGFVRWDADGRGLPGEPFPPGYFGGFVRQTGDATYFPVQVPGEGGGGPSDALIRIAGPDTVRLVRLPVPERRAIQLESCGMSFSGMVPLFTPTLRWAAAGRRVAVVAGPDYDVLVMEEGRPVMRVRRDVAPRPATERLALAEVGEGMQVRTEDGVRVCDPREVVEQRGFAPVVPVVDRVALAPDGSLWVKRTGTDEEGAGEVGREAGRVDLFAPDGSYLGTLPSGSPFPIAFFPDGRIAAAETDALEVTRLVVYRVEGA